MDLRGPKGVLAAPGAKRVGSGGPCHKGPSNSPRGQQVAKGVGSLTYELCGPLILFLIDCYRIRCVCIVLLKGSMFRIPQLTLDFLIASMHPFDALHMCRSSMPRDVATVLGVERAWELINERRQQNRELYIELMTSRAKANQLRSAVEIAALVCRMSLDLLLLPDDAVLQVLEFVVVQQCIIDFPAPLVTWVTTPVGWSWRDILDADDNNTVLIGFGIAETLVLQELRVTEVSASYLRRMMICVKNQHARNRGNLDGVASRHLPADVDDAVYHLIMKIDTREGGGPEHTYI